MTNEEQIAKIIIEVAIKAYKAGFEYGTEGLEENQITTFLESLSVEEIMNHFTPVS